jgi:RsiW-degrading membrane proteinase PrsW (M82 family)
MAKRPGGVMLQGTEATRSQLIPFVTKWEEIGKKAQLGPILFCIAAYFAINFFSDTTCDIILPTGKDPLKWVYSSRFLVLLSFLLTAVTFYFIYRVVGKNKSWWILLGAFAFSAYFIWLDSTEGTFSWLWIFFHVKLAGEGKGEPSLFQWIVGTGFFEEFVKSIPVLILAVLSARMSPSLRKKIGVEEPLDGILIGCASAGGFAIAESLLQYIPNDLVAHWIQTGVWVNHNVWVSMDDLGQFLQDHKLNEVTEFLRGFNVTHMSSTLAVPLVITRNIDQAFGHMAYSGYFGYFIGLSILKPEQRWKILGIGLVSAAIPHALWDWVQDFEKPVLSAAVAVFSYAVLAAAILKAREISPNRAGLQPSVIFGPGQLQPSTNIPVAVRVSPVVNVGGPTPAPMSGPSMAPIAAAGSEVNGSGARLRIGSRYLVIVAGLRLLEHQVPGLTAQTRGGPVAEVTRNPNDPSVLGLTNLSTSAWETVSASGARRLIATGQTIKLGPGTKIDFGSTDGEVA